MQHVPPPPRAMLIDTDTGKPTADFWKWLEQVHHHAADVQRRVMLLERPDGDDAS